LAAALGGALVVGLLVAGSPGLLSPYTSCSFTTDGATMTMTLNGDCTTDETIGIPDGWTLDGGGHTITGIDPPGGHFVGGVVENAGAVAHVRDLTVTVSGLANVCDGGEDRLRGILFTGADGSIVGNVATGINQGSSGCQEGNGIEVRNAPFDGSHPGTKEVTIAGNVVTGYQKNGITANGDVRATIRDNVVTGAGMVDYIAQNGIQLGFGATGHVRGNLVSGNWYTPEDFVAAGILVFEASGAMILDNTVADSQIGVAIESWCFGAPAASNNKVVRNTVLDAQAGVSVHTFTFFSACDPHADNNKVIQNAIVGGVGGSSVGVSVGAFDLDGGGGFTPSADNNKVVNNAIDGFATEISDAGTRTKIPSSG
jgi:hypothetical protein